MAQYAETEGIIHLCHLFQTCDLQGTGYLQLDGFAALWRALAFPVLPDGDQLLVREAFDMLDQNADGSISCNDFLCGLEDILNIVNSLGNTNDVGSAAANPLQAALQAYDRDRDLDKLRRASSTSPSRDIMLNEAVSPHVDHRPEVSFISDSHVGSPMEQPVSRIAVEESNVGATTTDMTPFIE